MRHSSQGPRARANGHAATDPANDATRLRTEAPLDKPIHFHDSGNVDTQATAHAPAGRLASALNAACQCIWLDRERLHTQLELATGNTGLLLDERPGLAAGSVVFVDQQDAAAMDRTCALIHRALMSPAFARHVGAHSAQVANPARDSAGALLGFDFHLGSADPQLIEINTNPGGLLVNLELARALTACCDQVAAPLARLASGSIGLDELATHVVGHFAAEWQRARGDARLETIAIVDDDPHGQFLFPEFVLYQRLFERAGWHAPIVDAAELEICDGRLVANGRRIDLVYNRVTDFYLAEPRHAALRRASEEDLAVVTPNPSTHARWADKRLLAWLRDEALLGEAGLDADERSHLLKTIPPTEIVTADAADDLWQRRKELFFKPVSGYGSKAAYRGDKLTRRTFEHILANRYVAQTLVPTSVRRVIADGQPMDLRVDVRNYGSAGATWLRAARLYRGQTTNFRTPGGGFASVLTLPG